jgi:hypothetical protein
MKSNNKIIIDEMTKEELKELIIECIKEALSNRNDRLEIISESNSNSTILIWVEKFFEHMIKFIYNPSIQTSSWVNSIIESSGEIGKIFKGSKKDYNEFKKVESDKFYKSFIDGRNKCMEDNKYISCSDAENVYNMFSNIDEISNLNKVVDTCLYYAKNDIIKEHITRRAAKYGYK